MALLSTAILMLATAATAGQAAAAISTDPAEVRLVGPTVTINQGRLYIDNVGGILATLHACVQPPGSVVNEPMPPTGPV